jgi:hypothetical protein
VLVETRGQEPLVARYTPRLEKIRADFLSAPTSIENADGFGKLAIANSEDRRSRFKGGDLGWLQDGRPMDALRTIVHELAGQLREPGEAEKRLSQDLLKEIPIERYPDHLAAIEDLPLAISRPSRFSPTLSSTDSE